MRSTNLILAVAITAATGCSSQLEPTLDAGAAPAPVEVGDPTTYSIKPQRFGQSMAVGDFNHDGYDDVAIGSPGATVDGKTAAGWVAIYLATPTGLGYATTLTSDDTGVAGATDALFGYSLAARDMDGDGYADLVIGCPHCLVNGKAAGAVFVYHGGKRIVSTGQELTQAMFKGEVAEADDHFGWEVAIGFFGGAGHPSIAVGVDQEQTGSPAMETGWVNIFNISPTLIATPSQGFNHTPFGPNVMGNFGSQLAVINLDDDPTGAEELVVGGTQAYVDVFKGSPLAPWQTLTEQTLNAGVGQGLGVGYFHNKHFPATGHRMPELAVTMDHDIGHIGIFTPTAVGSAWELALTDEIDDPGAHAAQFADAFGVGDLHAADLNHDGTDELFVPVPDDQDGSNGHVDVFKSAGGAAMAYWNDRAMPSPPACDVGCRYSSSIALGHFHTGVAANSDFDMAVGAPEANLVDLYKADGNGTIPSFTSSITNP